MSTKTGAAGGDDAKTDPDRPHLVVFDMNYTLWPHHIVEDPTPPLRRDVMKDGKFKLIDGNEEEFTPMPGIEDSLKKLKSQGHKLAIASTCKDPEQLQKVLDLMEWEDLFDYKAMIPGKPKTRHFNRLHEASSIAYHDMLFFDDKKKNLDDVRELGVICAEVGDELSWSEIERGLKMYKKGVSD